MYRKYYKDRLKMEDHEVLKWKNYLKLMYSIPESSEKAFYNLFSWPRLRAKKPLEHLLPKMNIPVHFFYGDNDWMEKIGAKKLFDT